MCVCVSGTPGVTSLFLPLHMGVDVTHMGSLQQDKTGQVCVCVFVTARAAHWWGIRNKIFHSLPLLTQCSLELLLPTLKSMLVNINNNLLSYHFIFRLFQ